MGADHRQCRATGLRIHDLRHSFASVGAGAGMGLPIVGKLLGHSQPSTTLVMHISTPILCAVPQTPSARALRLRWSGRIFEVADWLDVLPHFKLNCDNEDLKPLAAMLRGNMPIPRWVRHELADYIDPSERIGFRLCVKWAGSRSQCDTYVKSLKVAAAYKRQRALGFSSEDASFHVAEQHGIDPRSVLRHVKSWRQRVKRLNPHLPDW